MWNSFVAFSFMYDEFVLFLSLNLTYELLVGQKIEHKDPCIHKYKACIPVYIRYAIRLMLYVIRYNLYFDGELVREVAA